MPHESEKPLAEVPQTYGELEELYEKSDFEALCEIFRVLQKMPKVRRSEPGRQLLRKLWPDEDQWIQNTHWIQTKNEGLKLFRWNYAQQEMHKEIRRVRAEGGRLRFTVLKARQLGLSTFITSWQYEQIDRDAHRNAMVISYDDWSTKTIFRMGRRINSNMWFPRKTDRAGIERLQFSSPHGSSYESMTAGNESAGRSWTVNQMHYSELPMWKNADETLVAANECIPDHDPASSVFYESTAKGAVGRFYEDWKGSERGENDLIRFFVPWFWDKGYVYDFVTVDERRAFMRKLPQTEREYQRRHNLTDEQIAWRWDKVRNKYHGNVRHFEQENPGSPEEAFLTSGYPAFNPERVMELARNAAPPRWRGNILLTEDT